MEYLLYCKQYLDHSVIILKDELRLKLEDNVKLKKNLAAAEDSVKELKEKLRENYKLFEKTLTDSRGEVHKCPYCPKSFKSAIFTNLHINRRHSNSPQVSILSPVHDQYKAETEKLHNEIKTLKERLNQTERIVRNESSKLYESIELRERDKYEKNLEVKNNHQDKIEEEHRKYREEISNLTSMLFSEIKNLKVEDKKSQVDETEKFKQLLKSQEDELMKLRDQVQELSLDKSKPDIEGIQIKLKAQEEYWQAKLNQLEDQHAKDIEKLSNQLQITQDSAMLIRDDYVSKIRDLEERSLDSGRFLSPKISPARRRRRAENFVTSLVERERPSEFNKLREVDKSRSDSDESINKFRKILVTSADVHDNVQQKVGFKNDTVLGNGGKEINFNSWTVNDVGVKKLDQSIEKKFNIKDSFKPIASQIKEEKNRMDVSSEESESDSRTSSESGSSGSESGSESETETESEDSEETESEEKVAVKNFKTKEDDKTKEDIRKKVWEDFEQKLRDLGIDPDCDEISEEIYKRSMEMVKHHRNLSARKFGKFEEIRRRILNQLHDKFPRHEVRKSPLRKLVSSVKSRAVKAFSNPSPSQEHVPKLKSKVMSPERSVSNKFNMELLPKKISQQELPVRRGSRDANPMSPSHERYTPSPSKNNAKPFSPEPIVDTKFSHSYESIKDYMRDLGKKSSPAFGSPLRSPYLNKALATSTPHRAEINVLPSHRASVSDLSSPVAKPREFSLPSSPKNSKSVLKTTSGSTGSLVKKKVLFDLEPMTDTSEKIDKPESNGVISSISKNKINDENDDSESDYEISSISEEKSDFKILEPVNNSNIVLKTSQSEKIAQISRKIESQLSLTRHKPAGAVEAMFKGFNLHEDDDDDDESLAGFSVDRNNVNVQSFNKVIKLPQPTPRTQRLRVSSPDKSADKDSNLDNDIDEILCLE